MVGQERDTKVHVDGSEFRAFVHEALEDSRKQRFVIRRKNETKMIDVSVLAAVIIGIAAPPLLGLVLIGLLLEKISVSVESVETRFE